MPFRKLMSPFTLNDQLYGKLPRKSTYNHVSQGRHQLFLVLRDKNWKITAFESTVYRVALNFCGYFTIRKNKVPAKKSSGKNFLCKNLLQCQDYTQTSPLTCNKNHVGAHIYRNTMKLETKHSEKKNDEIAAGTLQVFRQ